MRWINEKTLRFKLLAVVSFAVLASILGITFVGPANNQPPIRAASLGAVTTPAIAGPVNQTANQILASLPTDAAMLSEIQNEQVAAVVNGTTISSVQIASLTASNQQTAAESAASGLVASSASTSALGSSISASVTNLSGPAKQAEFLNSGIAMAVFQQLLFNYAVSNGIEEPLPTATASATSAYNHWVAAGSPSVPIPGYMPAGTTVEDMFTSPKAIASLQFLDSVQAAESAIAGPAAVNQALVNRQPALLKWFNSNLGTNQVSVTVAGNPVSAGTLPGLLPTAP